LPDFLEISGMLKKNIVWISCLGTLIFLAAPFIYGCSPRMIGLRGFWAAFFPLVFSIGTLSFGLTFFISLFSRSESNLRGGIWIVVWILAFILFFHEFRVVLGNICLK
jgi:hypothetical protein